MRCILCCSNVFEVRFESRFSGSETYLQDHRIDQIPVMPGVAYLEMAHAAMCEAFSLAGGAAYPRAAHSQATRTQETELKTQVMTMRDLVWLQPLQVSSDVVLNTQLDVLSEHSASLVFSASISQEQSQQQISQLQRHLMSILRLWMPIG